MIHDTGNRQEEFLIEIKNATVFRGAHCVFQNLTLSVPLNCHTVLLGPNGSGKTTLLKVLSRELYAVQRPTSLVRLLGREDWNVWDLRAQMGIISAELQDGFSGPTRGIDVILSGFFSSFALYGHHLVSPAQRAKGLAVMRSLGVDRLRDRPYQEMSTGEQRRLLLGRALVHDPRILVLDEPTTGLDLQGCFQYLHCIRECMRQGKTFLVATHHLHEIPPEVTRVVLLKNGRVMEDGPKKEVLTAGRLSRLFDVPLHLIESQGWYQAVPMEAGGRGTL